jgi:hypothetical protein
MIEGDVEAAAAVRDHDPWANLAVIPPESDDSSSSSSESEREGGSDSSDEEYEEAEREDAPHGSEVQPGENHGQLPAPTTEGEFEEARGAVGPNSNSGGDSGGANKGRKSKRNDKSKKRMKKARAKRRREAIKEKRRQGCRAHPLSVLFTVLVGSESYSAVLRVETLQVLVPFLLSSQLIN